jgi:O-succinylbenzoate synthase
VPRLTEHHLRIGDRRITLLEGPAGWGEISPLPGFPCDPHNARRAAEEAALVGWPEPRRTHVPVNALVTGAGFERSALSGFSAVKVKMQAPNDVDLVAAVRDAVGARVALRVDANGAWDVDTAVSVVDRLVPLNVELVEQPVRTLDELAQVRRRVQIPIAADECVRTLDDARRLRDLDAADAVVLKVQPLGGVRVALDLADAAGVPAIPSSMMETSVGIAAGLALAAALPDLPYACGLATAALLPGDVTHRPLLPDGGELEVRAVAPDPDLLARYTDESQDVSAAASSAGRSR